MRRTLKEQIENRCVHFNGVHYERCRAGVRYNEIDKDNRRQYRAGLPCLRGGTFDAPKSCCEKLQWPTEDEVQHELLGWEEAFRKAAS